MTHTRTVYYFNAREDTAALKLTQTLSSILPLRPSVELVVLCIGSDRVTGDSLGPLIGYKLSKIPICGLYLYGTLDQPVHAMNLCETIELIKLRHPSTPVIAIDASLGSRKYQGFITTGRGPLHPGTGVHKELPCVGDLFITGIVNTSGMLEQMVLQTTRLSTVMMMADCISQGIIGLF